LREKPKEEIEAEEPMRVVAFNTAPEASHVAAILADQGYETEIIDCDGSGAARAREISEAANMALWARAFLLTNCETDHLGQVLASNFGRIVLNRRPTAARAKFA
jgi:hypothetical protein